MITTITILIVLASAVLAFFILVQAPKGGGLTGNLGSLSTQVMGVKQSTDVMEKGTWSAMGVIAALCIISVIFINKPAREASRTQGNEKARSGAQAPAKQGAPAAAPAAPAKPAN
jgi:preprotein translocase subunit SecG